MRDKTGVPTDEKIRAFLLGRADEETEKSIEEGILDSTVGTDDVVAVEEELIDDHVFGRLSSDEEHSFHTRFLISQERRDKLQFSRALRTYARERSAAQGRRSGSLARFPRLILAFSFSVSGLAAIAVLWLGIRDARLTKELAVASRTSDERQRLLQSMEQAQRQQAAPVEKAEPTAQTQSPAAPSPAAELGIQLRPGVRRGVEAVPVLQVPSQAGAVRITLELAFKPEGGLREDLLRAGGERIWTQELPSAAQAVVQGMTSLYLPARLLSPGDYRIRVKDLASDASDEGDVYAFRVSRR